MMTRKEFLLKVEKIIAIVENIGGTIEWYEVNGEATNTQISQLISAYEHTLPEDFIQYIKQISSIDFMWTCDSNINNELSFIKNKSDGIFSGHIAWSIDTLLKDEFIKSFQECRKKEVDMSNYYTYIKNKVLILTVPNGDVHTIDVSNKNVIYLSHDGEFDTVFLGETFDKYITNYMKTLFIGSEMWQMQYFISEGIGIDPNSKNFLEFKQILNI